MKLAVAVCSSHPRQMLLPPAAVAADVMQTWDSGASIATWLVFSLVMMLPHWLNHTSVTDPSAMYAENLHGLSSPPSLPRPRDPF